MALTPSVMIPLGTKAPDFNLPDAVSGSDMSLEQLKSDKATVIMFICNHCPYVKHVQQGLVELANDYISKGVSLPCLYCLIDLERCSAFAGDLRR